LKNIKSNLPRLGVVAHWNACKAHTDGEVELKNMTYVTALAVEFLIEIYTLAQAPRLFIQQHWSVA
jgi:hypothetical protein